MRKERHALEETKAARPSSGDSARPRTQLERLGSERGRVPVDVADTLIREFERVSPLRYLYRGIAK